jgi:Fe-S-cluster containining protein
LKIKEIMENKENKKNIEVYLKEFAENQYGYDIVLNDENATLGDYVDALNIFQDNTMADCRGCDGCCYERIPLTVADFWLAKGLTAKLKAKKAADVTLTDWLLAAAEVHLDGDAIDIVLKRNSDYSCYFLNKEKQECREHIYRSLVCRTHCCLPKSQIAIDIRGDIINAGEDELCRCLLKIPDHPWQQLLAKCLPEDYPESGFSQFAPEDWRNIPLKSVISPENWQILIGKEK